MCPMKLDFHKAFNECDRRTMLDQVLIHFPELFRWSQWSYSCASELWFGHHRILSTIGVTLWVLFCFASNLISYFKKQMHQAPHQQAPIPSGTWIDWSKSPHR